MTTVSQEKIDYVEEIANQGLQVLVVEEESAEELQGVLNELRRQGYARIVGFSTAGVLSDMSKAWRYTAVVQQTGSTVRENKIPRRLGH